MGAADTTADKSYRKHVEKNFSQDRWREGSRTQAHQEALVYTRIRYGLPYMRVTEHQFRQINNLLRRITSITLGVPSYAASTFVKGTAIFNTLTDRLIVHQEAQSHRLTSKQGRALLELMGYNTANLPVIPLTATPWEAIPFIKGKSIPKHMNPEEDAARRAARTRMQQLTDSPSYHGDASFTAGKVVTASIDSCGNAVVNHHHDVPSVATAEMLAITQAITQHDHQSESILIRSDSQATLWAFLRNELPPNIRAVLAEYGQRHPES
ncbi:hypothetical protein HPB48_021357 [Haemaphysalis longicornis]|uniref:RNase H type-1 domain-containing protein n=1 Tax=Haemaphysalis longicornis TaxID=44386 RepID=A0A9J6FTM1_HAELO|nr:hypothetical protein HPB48_021357 [Haemaphysalis longicornis]